MYLDVFLYIRMCFVCIYIWMCFVNVEVFCVYGCALCIWVCFVYIYIDVVCVSAWALCISGYFVYPGMCSFFLFGYVYVMHVVNSMVVNLFCFRAWSVEYFVLYEACLYSRVSFCHCIMYFVFGVCGLFHCML